MVSGAVFWQFILQHIVFTFWNFTFHGSQKITKIGPISVSLRLGGLAAERAYFKKIILCWKTGKHYHWGLGSGRNQR